MDLGIIIIIIIIVTIIIIVIITIIVLSLLQGSAASSDETIVRYSSQYDQKLDPFTSFSKRERLRKYMDLRPYDKITLGMVSSGVNDSTV